MASLSQRSVTREQLRGWSERGRLFAILDACDEPHVPVKCRELGPAADSLYRGRADERLWAIAPYLVAVSPDTFDWIVATLWGRPWGIFALAEIGLADLATHFRRHLVVTVGGEQRYFRFYDPRVLPPFLASADPAMLDQFFGPVTAYAAAAGDAITAFGRAAAPPPTPSRITVRMGG